MADANNCITDVQRQAYEKLPAPLCAFHALGDDYQLLFISDGFCRLLGRSRDEITLSNDFLSDFVAPEDRDTARSAIEYARMSPNTESRVTYRLRGATGDTRVTSSSFSERLSDHSYLIFCYFSGLTCDNGETTTAPKSAISIESESSSLRQNSDYYRIAVWRVDLTENRVISYEAVKDRSLPLDSTLSYDEAAAWIGGSPHSPEDRGKLTALLDRSFLLKEYAKGHVFFSLQYRRDENNTMPFWVSVKARAFQSAANGHIECVITAFDVTEKILETQLISRLTLMGYEVVGLLSVYSGKVRYFRLKPMRFGMPFEHYEDYFDSIENDLDKVIAPDQRGAVSRALRLETIIEALREAPSYSYAFEVTTSDGRHRHKTLQFSYLDEVRDTIFLCKSDITRQYEKERAQISQLRAAKLEAERANAAKSTFLSSMSHDLRTPLNGVIGFTDLALDETDPARVREYLLKARSSGALLLDLVNDTLELSRVESGKSALTPEAISLKDMAEEVFTALQPSAEIKSLRFEADLDFDRDVIVWADRLKFQKIFLNLLSNAIKYTMPGGTVRAIVAWDAAMTDGYSCHITVQDTGIGISPAFLPRVFESFAQEKRPETANILGTGLGLSIVKKTVDQMNGVITVESKLDVGSVFRVSLPLTSAKTNQPLRSVETLPEIRLEGITVLLCEDNQLNAEIATTLLRNQGIIVETASNGRLGKEKFAASAPGHFSAVLMDIRMPEMDGYEAARAIRALPRPDAMSVPIIAMTADAFEEDIRECLEAGMNDHVTKPIDSSHLFDALRKQLGKAR